MSCEKRILYIIKKYSTSTTVKYFIFIDNYAFNQKLRVSKLPLENIDTITINSVLFLYINQLICVLPL